MSTKDGGPAFPTVIANVHDFSEGATLPLGMSLRDWFAGQIIGHVLYATMTTEAAAKVSLMLADNTEEAVAIVAYRCADAMLTEREKS